jgi:sulfur relay (sulfurtransferase) complex TusBCD TusD component (DsrE family)
LQVYTWGRGYCGALGHGDENDKTSPELISSLKNQVAVQVCLTCLHLLGSYALQYLKKNGATKILSEQFKPNSL